MMYEGTSSGLHSKSNLSCHAIKNVRISSVEKILKSNGKTNYVKSQARIYKQACKPGSVV